MLTSAEVAQLRARLQEAEETLEAIRNGEVDAVLVAGTTGDQLYTLRGADHQYRLLIEEMNEGAVIVDEQGTITYCNKRFAAMLRAPLERVIGSSFYRFVPQPGHAAFTLLLAHSSGGSGRVEFELLTGSGAALPVYLAFSAIDGAGMGSVCMVATDLTEQKRNEAIVADEQLARLILDQVTDAVVVCDVHGQVIRASQAAQRLAGQEALWRHFDELFALTLGGGAALRFAASGDRLDRADRILLTALAVRQELSNSEVSFVRADGAAFALLLNARPLLDSAATVIGYVITLNDITARKRDEELLQRTLTDLETRVQQRTAELEAANRLLLLEVTERKGAEQLLRGSENRLFQYLNALPVGVVVQDVAGRPYFYNSMAEQLFGRVTASAADQHKLGAGNQVYVAGTDRLYPAGRMPNVLAQAGERVTADDMEIRYERKIVPVEVSGAPIHDNEGRVTFTIATFRDITERKRAEAQLLASEQRFRALFENGLDSMLILDDGGRIVEANPAAGQLFALPAAALRGGSLIELVAHSDIEITAAMWRQLLAQGELAVERSFQVGDGGRRDLEVAARANFVPHYHLALIRDVTERNEAIQSRLARQSAERANLAKSEFLARMSHELRTPLNSILGFAQLLAMDELTAEQDESLGFILKGGRHLLGLINEVLDIARVEAGQLAITVEALALGDVLQESVELIAPLAAGRDIDIRVHDLPAMSGLVVAADRQRMTQVLLNLLSNGVKYNRAGGSITVQYRHVGAERIRIEILDSGPGIAAEMLQLLFSPFQRLGAERSSVEGTGLGLAMSKMLVEGMGGTIGVESWLGQGSLFWLEFALVMAPGALLRRKGTGQLILPPASAKQHTLLYIEDNPANLRLVERLVGRQPNTRLLSAQSGLGIELLLQQHVDMVLLDLHLPDIGGEEVLRRLKADPASRDIPVVILSADASAGTIARLMGAGAHDFLTKPLEVKRFMRVLGELLGQGERTPA